MNQLEISERFAEMWRRSRADGGKSQAYMARALGVSKKTVQNWEEGTSCPNQAVGFAWFDALGLPALPYYLELLYPGEIEGVGPGSSDQDIEDALVACVRSCSPSQKRKLLYFFYGSHGSSPAGVLELLTAHLHTPMRDRLNIAASIIQNYEVAEARGEIVGGENVQPNIPLLKDSLARGRAAVLSNKKCYFSIGE